MLAQLTIVKARLGISPADVTQDEMLTRVIQAVGARFERECNRVFPRTVGATHEFRASEREVIPACYPIETVTRFELKEDETDGWVEQTGVEFVIRRGCVISLGSALSTVEADVGRISYTGGFVLPGSVPAEGQTALPKDLEHAAIEQVAVWYQHRDKLGLIRHWPSSGTYLVLSQLPLLPAVSLTLRRHQRWSV